MKFAISAIFTEFETEIQIVDDYFNRIKKSGQNINALYSFSNKFVIASSGKGKIKSRRIVDRSIRLNKGKFESSY